MNFEKMRLVASNVRGLKKFKTGSLPQELRLTAHKNPTLQQYIRWARRDWGGGGGKRGGEERLIVEGRGWREVEG